MDAKAYIKMQEERDLELLKFEKDDQKPEVGKKKTVDAVMGQESSEEESGGEESQGESSSDGENEIDFPRDNA